jgi:hypothetical protein
MLKEGWYSRAEAGFKHVAAKGNTKHRGWRSSGQRCCRGLKMKRKVAGRLVRESEGAEEKN